MVEKHYLYKRNKFILKKWEFRKNVNFIFMCSIVFYVFANMFSVAVYVFGEGTCFKPL